MPRTPCLIATLITLSILLPGLAHAARKDDPLARTTPVPAGEPIPILDFFRPPLLRGLQVNAAGTHVASIGQMGTDLEGLLIQNLTNQKVATLAGGRDTDIYSFSWLTDDRILFSVSKEKLYANGLYVAIVDNMRKNYAIENYSVVRVVGRPINARTKPLIWVRHNAYEDGKDSGVMQIDAMRPVDNKNVVPGARGTSDNSGLSTYGVAASVIRSFPKPPEGLAVSYFADHTGELSYLVTVGAEEKLRLYTLQNNKWVPCPVDLDEVDIEEVSDRPGELLVAGPRESGKPRGLFRLQALTGEIGELVHRDAEYDCTRVRVRRDYETRRILGITYVGRTERTVWFDPARQQLQRMVEAGFRGQITTIIEADKANDRFVVETYSDRHPPTYHTVHLSQKSMGLFKSSHPWIDPERLQPQQILTYRSRDGYDIEAYLTLPSGATKANPAPLVVLPHGGPWVRDDWGFDGEVQFLASRGYAVLQPNYRGSPGYDWRFKPEDLRDFRKMHDDVTDGVKAIIGTGLIDEKRIAIMGASFGGYLAMCGAAFEPDLYRCAVTRVGVFDWEQMLAEARRDYTRRARYKLWLGRIGDPKEEAERLASISPLRHVDKVRIPIFVQHGREDNVVEVTQSRRLVAELKAHSVPHVVRIDKGEGHGNARYENRVELFTEIEAFLAQHLGPVRTASIAPAAPGPTDG